MNEMLWGRRVEGGASGKGVEGRECGEGGWVTVCYSVREERMTGWNDCKRGRWKVRTGTIGGEGGLVRDGRVWAKRCAW